MPSPLSGAAPAAGRVARSSLAIAALFLAMFVLALPLALQAQSYVYVNNQDVANNILAYSVSASGTLSPVAGSPFATGGVGSTVSCYGLDRITLNAQKNLLFVSNAGDQSISVFSIDPTTGVLTLGPGSPFSSGLTLDGCGGISLAATPDGNFLMASSNGKIQTFNVAANGVLASAGPATTGVAPNVGMKISADGKYLAVSNETSVSVYSVNADGSLTAVAPGSFPRGGTGLLSGVEFSCAADHLYGSEVSFGASTIVDAWSVDPTTGVLTALTKSPFLAPGSDSSTLALSPDNSVLFVNNQLSNKISSFTVNADGSLTSIGSFGGVGAVHTPGGMVTDAAGNFLIAADDAFGVAAFKITTSGGLTGVTDVAINRVGSVQGVAAYPPRSCASADLALTMTGSPATVDAGSNVTYTITITNNGPAAAGATIVDNLPSGEIFVACASTDSGVCSNTLPNPHTITFASLASGESQTVTLVAQTSASLLNGATLSNTVSLANKSAIDPDLTNNLATVATNVTAQAGPTTLVVSPATGTYGGLAILTATLQKSSNGAAIGGRAVTFTLNGAPVGTVTTNGIGQAILTTSVAGLPLGTYPGAIGASFAGDSLFTASSGTGNLTVNKAVLTVIGSSAARFYGDPNPATFTYNISGFMNGDTAAVVSGTTTCSTAATMNSPVGRYPVTCDLGTLSAANYTFTLFPGTLIINPAPLTVTADNQTRVYGDPNPVFTGTVTGLKLSDVLTPTYSTQATQFAPAGNYPIVPFIPPSTVSANYAITYVNGTLTVTPAPLTVNVDSASRLYGDPNPVFTGTILGIKNNDVITATYSTTATQSSPIGTYPITATLAGLALGNYTVTINNSTLAITSAALTVNVDSFTRLYGDPNPVFTGTILGVKNGDNITATYSSTATQASPIGVYPITATLVDPTLKLSNYTVTINNGTLTINPAPLTVTAANVTRLYGAANPVLTGTIVGIKNADNITATYSTPADPTSSVGAYPIIPTLVDPSNLLGNYTVTINNGVLTINPAPLVVTPANTNRLYGDPNPALTGTLATVLNGDPITATFTTTATQASPVGTYPITATLSDPAGKLSNYTVTIKTGTLTVRPAPLTVTGFNGTRFYGDPNPAPTIIGIKNGDPITAGYDAAAPGPTTPAAGTFTLVPVLSDAGGNLSNYTVTIQNGRITINKAPLSVVANNVSRPFGSPNPTLTGTITGVKNGENITASFTTTATQTSNVGTFAITVAVVFNPTTLAANYTLTTTNGTLTITAVPLTIAANNQTIILGGSVAASATYTGFVLGQTPANLSGTLNCSAQAGTGNVGSSAINCSGQSSTNYTITFTPGTATVTYAPVGFTAPAGKACGIGGTDGGTQLGAGHVILSPIAAGAPFTKATTPNIPVQFRVCDANGNSVSANGVVSSFTLTAIDGVPASTPAPTGTFGFVGGALININPTTTFGTAGSQGWALSLSTGSLTAGHTYAYRINLNDGTSIGFQFSLQ